MRIRLPTLKAAEQLSGERLGQAALESLREVERLGEPPVHVAFDPPSLDDDCEGVVAPEVDVRDPPGGPGHLALLGDETVPAREGDLAVGRVCGGALRQAPPSARELQVDALELPVTPGGALPVLAPDEEAEGRLRVPQVSVGLAEVDEAEGHGVADRLPDSDRDLGGDWCGPETRRSSARRRSGARARSGGRTLGRRRSRSAPARSHRPSRSPAGTTRARGRPPPPARSWFPVGAPAPSSSDATRHWSRRSAASPPPQSRSGAAQRRE